MAKTKTEKVDSSMLDEAEKQLQELIPATEDVEKKAAGAVLAAEAKAEEARAEAESLRKENASLKLALEAEKKSKKVTVELPTPSTNYVLLDGKKYDLVHRNTVRELAEDMKKRYVDENLTAVVINKHGG